ncbi:Rv3654c family TadE-like protein [Streptomyces acidicola]|uniref:Rv3654c family TadE-like protein n=1 Tax=Streptomyces acidicola TaxID=2596892 RepID=UPI0037A96C7B
MTDTGHEARTGDRAHRKPWQQSASERSRRTDHRSDRGSATVWAVGAIAVLCVIFGALLAMGQAVVIRHRAAGAADLAALAATDHWTTGTDAACAMAERVARAQGTRLVRCAIEGETSDVTAASGKGPFSAEARSRAGPAGPVTPGTTAPGPVAPGTTALQAPAPNAPHTERARPSAVSPPVPPAKAP